MTEEIFGEDKLHLTIEHLEGLRKLLTALMETGAPLSHEAACQLDEVDRQIEIMLKMKPTVQ